MTRTANRLRRALRSVFPREVVQARIDACWLLKDGSLCVDGWLVEAGGTPGAIEARLIQPGSAGAWSPLLRKDRPDVASHVLGAGAPQVGFGIVGWVAGPLTTGSRADLELRGPWGRVRVRLPAPHTGAVPEEAFAGLVVDFGAITPAALSPVVNVIRLSKMPPSPTAAVAYRHSAASTTPLTGIVLPVYREFTYVKNLLRALADDHDDIELTMVCDDPTLTAALAEWVGAWNESVYRVPMQIVAHDRNAGFAAACNSGWTACEAGVVLLLNSDILIDRPGVDLNVLRNGLTDDVAAVAPVLIYPDGTLQHAGMAMVDAPDFPGFVLPGHPGKHGGTSHLPETPFEVPMLTGAAVALRRESLQAVGGVPHVYGRGDFEDVLLSLALRERGRLVIDPRVRWAHVEGASYRRDELGGIAVTLAKSIVIAERTGGRR